MNFRSADLGILLLVAAAAICWRAGLANSQTIAFSLFFVSASIWIGGRFGSRKTGEPVEKINRRLRSKIGERVKIQNKLPGANDLQQGIFDSADYSIISTDVDGIIRVFNRGAEKMLGYRAEEIVGKVTPAIFHAENEVAAKAKSLSLELGRTIDPGFEVFVCKSRDGASDENEWTYIRKDGSRLPVNLSVTALKDAGGKVTGFLGIGKDITQVKQADALLQKEKHLLEIIARGESTDMLVKHVAGIFEKFDDRIASSVLLVGEDARLHLYASSNLSGEFCRRIDGIPIGADAGPCPAAAFFNSIVIISDIESDARWENFNKLALQSEIKSSCSIPIPSQTGEVLAVFALFKPTGWEPTFFEKSLMEKFAKLLGIAIEKHRNDAARRESEATIRSFYESASMMMGVVEITDDDIIHISDNPATARFFGREASRFTKQSARERGISPALLELWLSKYREARDSGKPASFVYEHQTPAESHWLSVTVSYIGQSEAKKARFSYVVLDITEQKLDESRIKQSLVEKESLLKEIHHRVKNNLQVISSLFSLQANYISDPSTLEVFGESRRRVHSMALIHEKLYRGTDFAKIDFTEYIYDLAYNLFSSYPINPDSIALKLDIENLFLDIEQAIPCGLIVNELISNAIKYAFPEEKNGNEISISLSSDADGRCTLSVSDNGAGLPAGFDPDRSETLGLRLVGILTRQLNGSLTIRNDRGTMFEIQFPVPVNG